MLRVDGLSKTYVSGPPWRRRTLRALEDVTFSVNPGEILALLGANGAGKTTLLKILAALVEADRGVAEKGSDPVGFASGEERSLFFRLTGRQNLDFFAALHGLRGSERRERITALADEIELDGFLDRRVDSCSSGMRARIGLARALLHRPRVLLLDEPTKSLDPAHAERARQLVAAYARRGNAVVLATHLPEEAAALATTVGVLDAGRLTLHPPHSDWRSCLLPPSSDAPQPS